MADRRESDKDGKIKRRGRVSLLLPVFFAAILTVLAVMLAARVRSNISIPVSNDAARVSESTKNVLAGTQGKIRVICFMERKNPAFGFVARLLNALRLSSRSVAGADLQLEFVDPNWDVQRSARLANSGAERDTIVFERQRRKISVQLADLFPVSDATPAGHQTSYSSFRRAESVCAAAITRLSLPAGKCKVYWLCGHGEARFDNYDERYGYSDIVRDLFRNGYSVESLSLSDLREIPYENGLLVIAGARNRFAKSEINMLNSYLQRGGRILCMLNPAFRTELETMLEKWGVGSVGRVAVGKDAVSGGDLPTTPVSGHPVCRGLENSTVLFGAPLCLEPVRSGDGIASFEVNRLLTAGKDSWGESEPDKRPRVYDAAKDTPGPVSVALASETGGKMARDVLYRPTRICVVGEADFVSNGILASRANANREFFLNAISWLAGMDLAIAAVSERPAGTFSGVRRVGRVQLLLTASLFVPAVVLLLFAVSVAYRRRNGR